LRPVPRHRRHTPWHGTWLGSLYFQTQWQNFKLLFKDSHRDLHQTIIATFGDCYRNLSKIFFAKFIQNRLLLFYVPIMETRLLWKRQQRPVGEQVSLYKNPHLGISLRTFPILLSLSVIIHILLKHLFININLLDCYPSFQSDQTVLIFKMYLQ